MIRVIVAKYVSRNFVNKCCDCGVVTEFPRPKGCHPASAMGYIEEGFGIDDTTFDVARIDLVCNPRRA